MICPTQLSFIAPLPSPSCFLEPRYHPISPAIRTLTASSSGVTFTPTSLEALCPLLARRRFESAQKTVFTQLSSDCDGRRASAVLPSKFMTEYSRFPLPVTDNDCRPGRAAVAAPSSSTSTAKCVVPSSPFVCRPLTCDEVQCCKTIRLTDRTRTPGRSQRNCRMRLGEAEGWIWLSPDRVSAASRELSPYCT